MKTLINCTPHSIMLNDPIYGKHEFPPSGTVARCKESITDIEYDSSITYFPVKFVKLGYGEVTDLPEPKDSVIYIVSAMVRMALPHRKDLVSPSITRDANGNVNGCDGFVTN